MCQISTQTMEIDGFPVNQCFIWIKFPKHQIKSLIQESLNLKLYNRRHIQWRKLCQLPSWVDEYLHLLKCNSRDSNHDLLHVMTMSKELHATTLLAI